MPIDQLTKERQLTKTKPWEKALNLLYIDLRAYCHDELNKFNGEGLQHAQMNCRKILTLLSILDPNHTLDLYPILEKTLTRLSKVREMNMLIEALKDKRKQAKEAGDSKAATLIKVIIDHYKDKRKAYRKKLADELPKLINTDLEEKWKIFLSEQLEVLVIKKDINALMRELEVAYEQKKKACKALFREQGAESEEAYNSLNELRLAAKQLQLTASAAAFALHQKFHGYEEIYKQIQEQLGQISDQRRWLEMLNTTGREELDIGKKAWNTFISQLNAKVLGALYQNNVIHLTPQPK